MKEKRENYLESISGRYIHNEKLREHRRKSTEFTDVRGNSIEGMVLQVYRRNHFSRENVQGRILMELKVNRANYELF